MNVKFNYHAMHVHIISIWYKKIFLACFCTKHMCTADGIFYFDEFTSNLRLYAGILYCVTLVPSFY